MYHGEAAEPDKQVKAVANGEVWMGNVVINPLDAMGAQDPHANWANLSENARRLSAPRHSETIRRGGLCYFADSSLILADLLEHAQDITRGDGTTFLARRQRCRTAIGFRRGIDMRRELPQCACRAFIAPTQLAEGVELVMA